MQYPNPDQDPGKNKLLRNTDSFHFTLNTLFSLQDIAREYFSNLTLQSLPLSALCLIIERFKPNHSLFIVKQRGRYIGNKKILRKKLQFNPTKPISMVFNDDAFTIPPILPTLYCYARLG